MVGLGCLVIRRKGHRVKEGAQHNVSEGTPKRLADLVKSLRLAQGWTSAELARRWGCARSFVTLVENGNGRTPGESIPSEVMLRKLAALLCADEEERLVVLQQLLLGRIRALAPEEVAGYLTDRLLEPMPAAFCARLKQALVRLSPGALSKIEDTVGISGRLKLVSRGLGRLTPAEVRLVADAFKWPVDTVLAEAEYFPERMKQLMASVGGSVRFLDIMNELSTSAQEEFFRFMQKKVRKAEGLGVVK